jgi:tetratricopeptide (TPR) repeat protein
MTFRFMTCLAAAYEEAGRFEQAEPLLMDVLARRRKAHDREPYEAATALDSLGLNQLKQHKYAGAEPLLRECLSIREEIQRESWETFNAKSMLGGSLLGQNRHDEAEPLLLAGYEGMKQREREIPPIRKSRLTEAIERLVRLYEATGRKEKADEWRRKLPVPSTAKPAETKKG